MSKYALGLVISLLALSVSHAGNLTPGTAESSDEFHLLLDRQDFSLGQPAAAGKPRVIDSQASGSEKDVAVGSRIALASAGSSEQFAIETGGLPLIGNHESLLDTPATTGVSPGSGLQQVKNLTPHEAAFLLPQAYFKTFPETDLIALKMRGNGEWERLDFSDLDAAFSESGDRYLPLIRLMSAFGLGATASGDMLYFRTTAGDEIELFLSRGKVAVNGELIDLDFVSGVSDVTLRREIYLPTEIFSRIFEFDISWDDLEYQYVVTTDETLPVWTRHYSRMKGMDAVTIPDAQLPSVYDEASPEKSLVSFVETSSSFSATYQSEGSSTTSYADSSVRLWGHLWDGQYRMRMEVPRLSYNDTNGVDHDDRNVLVPRQFQWKKDMETSQLSVGDVGLALNDLAMPSTGMMGVRFNGVGTLGEDSVDAKRSGYGISRLMVADKVYTGVAEIGSVVSLVVNERVIQSVTVVADSDAPIGFGTYEFDEISIGGGSNAEVRIDVLEPSGRLVSIDKPVVSGAGLLPKGSYSYLGGLGTRRSYNEWDAEGMLGGARLLYGLSSNLTVGLSAGHQEDLYQDSGFTPLSREFRGLPQSSSHIGTEFSARLLPSLTLSGDFARSSGEGHTAGADEWFDGSGVRLLSEWRPLQRMRVDSTWFRYDPGFFNGSNNTDLQDREGYGVNLSIPSNRWFNLSGGFGRVNDNLDGQMATTNRLDYQNINLYSHAIPYTALRVGASHLQPGEGEDRTRIEMDASWSLRWVNLGISKATNTGNRNTAYFTNLMRGLNLPGIDLYNADNTSVSAQFRLPENHRLNVSWNQNENAGGSSDRVIVNHYWSGLGLFGMNEQLPRWFRDRRFSISSAIDFSSEFDEKEIRTFIGIPLRGSSRSTVRLAASYNDRRGAYLGFNIDIEKLFATNKRVTSLVRVPDYFNPNYGGVQGIVYLDTNANAVRDPGEPGISEIGIVSAADGNSIRSGSNGNFLFEKRPDVASSAVFLDIDSIPAHLAPTHGKQVAAMLDGAVTKLEFGLAPVVSVSGLLLAQQDTAGTRFKPMRGARVYLLDSRGSLVSESITAGDGSYFMDVIPGKYSLKIDGDTVKSNFILDSLSRDVVITGVEEYQEKDLATMYAKLLSVDEIERMSARDESKYWDLNIPLMREEGIFTIDSRSNNAPVTNDLIIIDPGFDI